MKSDLVVACRIRNTAKDVRGLLGCYGGRTSPAYYGTWEAISLEEIPFRSPVRSLGFCVTRTSIAHVNVLLDYCPVQIASKAQKSSSHAARANCVSFDSCIRLVPETSFHAITVHRQIVMT